MVHKKRTVGLARELFGKEVYAVKRRGKKILVDRWGRRIA